VIPLDAAPGSAPPLHPHQAALDPVPTADAAPPAAYAAPPADFELSRAVMRLLVGSALLGADEMQKRLRVWEEALRAAPPPAAAPGEAADQAEVLRYALIGLAFETHDQMRKGMNELFDGMINATGSALARLGPLLDTPLLRPFTAPLLAQMDALVESSAERTARLARLGQREERHSRRLAEGLYAEALDDFIAYLSENPELRALIQSQSISVAAEVQNRFRQTTVDLDATAEAVFRRLLGRKPRRDLPPSPLVSVFDDSQDAR
jgi:hypothetical protein